MTDSEIGKFLLQELWGDTLLAKADGDLCDDWWWSGRIIAAMRSKGYLLLIDERYEKFVSFTRESLNNVACGICDGDMSPRTVALAAARALGMKEVDGVKTD